MQHIGLLHLGYQCDVNVLEHSACTTLVIIHDHDDMGRA